MPRTRGRSLAAATLGALALVGSLLVATPAQAINDTGTGGVFIPASGRVLDTKVGTGGYNTPMAPGNYRTVKIAGLAGIPDDGSVGAVSLNASVSGTDSSGTLFGRPDADTSRTMMLIYNDTAGEYVSNSAIVAVSTEGTIQVATETSARLILDVQGYYTSNDDGTAAGGFVPVAGKRFVDTRSGLGATKSTLAPGKSIDIQVAGANGVPNGASAAVVNLLPINTTSSDGYLTPYATGATRPGNALHYAPSTNTSIQAQVQLSDGGKMTIYNGSSTINLVIDLQGYFTAAGTAGATFTPGIGRVYNSTASGNTIFAKNETRSVQIAGRAGVPLMGSGINSVVLTLTAYHAGSEGRATVWADGTDKPDTTSINFRNDEIRTNTVTVPLGANGKISLNNVADPTHYLIDVQGWYVAPASPTIQCASPYAAGAWTAENPAAPVSCEFTAPAASASDEVLDVLVNGLPAETFVLNESQRSTFTYEMPDLSGRVMLEARIATGDVVRGSTSYEFGVGNWADDVFAPSIESGTVVDPGMIVLSPIPERATSLPSDVSVAYTLTDLSSGESDTMMGDDAPVIVEDLARGHEYSWTATATALSSWGTEQTVAMPAWSFRVANEGEIPTSTDPAEGEEAGGVFAAMKAPNGCTMSPDRWGSVNFKPACDKHDICYANKKKISRLSCDKAFRTNLKAICKASLNDKRAITRCKGIADVYYGFVRAAGWAFYKGNGAR